MGNLETYGLNEQDLLNVQYKIAKQKNYLKSQTFLGEGGKEKSLLDVSYSANFSERYYPRILNKVDTFVSISLNLNLVPVFLTVTADGFFRRMLKGDYSEWTDELKESYKKHIPNNVRNGYYYDYMDKHNALTPKDVYKIIGYQLHRFYMCETLRAIKKDGYKYTSIRVTEPHKDGVPHFHILMYVPEHYIRRLYKEFMRFFPAPQNHKKLTMKNTKGKSQRDGHYICEIDGVKMYETHGFQTQIRSAAGYILKYILKSFNNLIEGKEIDYLGAWYVHNKIPRIITTHTLVSQDIYHKSSMMDNDWYYLTNIKLNGDLINDRLNNYFKFDDGFGRKIIHDNGLYILTNNGKVISTFGQKQNFIPKYRLRALKFSVTCPDNFDVLHQYEIYTPFKKYHYYISKVYDDGTFFVFGNNNDFYIDSGITHEEEYFYSFPSDYALFASDSSSKASITSLTDFTLSQKYYAFDFDKEIPQRWAFMHNEMIYRGLVRGERVDVNEYSLGVLNDW